MGFAITSYKNLSSQYIVDGGAVVAGSLVKTGNTTNNGATVAGTATFAGQTLTLSTPGPLDPGNLATPNLSFKVKAGLAGSTIRVLSGVIALSPTVAGLPATVTCPATEFASHALASTSVVAPGAPIAIDDTATTAPGHSVTINVLANDKPNGMGQPPDPTTLTITTPPAHGTAVVSGGRVVYTPNGSFTTSDSFVYSVCDHVAAPTTTTAPATTTTASTTTTTTAPAVAATATTTPTTAASTTTTTTAPTTTTTAGIAAPAVKDITDAVLTAATDPLACDPATVTITAAAATATTPAPATAPTGASAGTPTAPAATTLPRTGGSSRPMAILGSGLIVAGLGALALTRRRRAIR
jgi:LPXTG-motif cell wall-anchored protein